MQLKWNDNFLTGIEPIDNEHKSMFEEFNRICYAAESGVDGNGLIRMINLFEQTAMKHVENEERIQVDSHFPNYIAHKNEHELFVSKLTRLKHELVKERATFATVAALITAVVDCMGGHIRSRDKELGNFLRGNDKTA